MKIKKLNFTIDFKKPDFASLAEKMFGKMRRILENSKMVRLEISMRLYRDGNKKPTTIFMEGARSASGEWNTWFPRDEDSRVLESPEILQEGLSKIAESVRSYITENSLGKDWSRMEGELREEMKSALSVDILTYRSEIPVRAIAKYGYDAHLYAPLMAIACMIEGAEALEKNDREHASHCVEWGLYWSSQKNLISDPRNRFSDRGRTNGPMKAVNFQPVKDKAAELLVELEPGDGWISTREAVRRVADDLAKKHLVLVDDCGLAYHNLSRTIGGWVEREPERFPHRIRPKA